MKLKTNKEIEQGHCRPEKEGKLTGFSRALGMLNLPTPASSTPHTPVLILSNAERKAIETYRLQVEKRRSMAAELARRNTFG